MHVRRSSHTDEHSLPEAVALGAPERTAMRSKSSTLMMVSKPDERCQANFLSGEGLTERLRSAVNGTIPSVESALRTL